MKTPSNKMILSAALGGIVALSAPLAASAQSQRATDYRAPAANERQVQPERGQSSQSQNRPSANAPQQQVQRPTQNSHSQQRALQTGSYRVTSTVNIRDRASTQSRRVGQARARTTVQIDRVSGNWLHIRNKGWISAQYAERLQDNRRDSQPSRR